MVLYGAEHLTERAQAYDLLERAARLHWGWDRLPEMAREERGKPYFPGAPQYHFNLSHSGPFALCALSDRPVGVDIQVVQAGGPQLHAGGAVLAGGAGGPAGGLRRPVGVQGERGEGERLWRPPSPLPAVGPAARRRGTAPPGGGVSLGGAAAPGLRRPGLAGGGVRLGGAAGGDPVADAVLKIYVRTEGACRVKGRALCFCA